MVPCLPNLHQVSGLPTSSLKTISLASGHRRWRETPRRPERARCMVSTSVEGSTSDPDRVLSACAISPTENREARLRAGNTIAIQACGTRVESGRQTRPEWFHLRHIHPNIFVVYPESGRNTYVYRRCETPLRNRGDCERGAHCPEIIWILPTLRTRQQHQAFWGSCDLNRFPVDVEVATLTFLLASDNGS